MRDAFLPVAVRLRRGAMGAALVAAGLLAASAAFAQPAPTQPAPAAPSAAPAPAAPAAAPAAQPAPAAPAPAAAPAADHAAGDAHAQPSHFPMRLPEQMRWSFAGFFGTYDTAQLQRGFQVFKEVCASCHSLEYVAFRNFGDAGGPHFSEAQVRALAAEYQVQDGPNDDGDMFERPAIPSDRWPSPFANPQAAAVANGGAVPPDLSLMAKARGSVRGPVFTVLDFFTQYQEGGPDYIHALLTGYTDPPVGIDVPEGTYFNPYFNAAVSLKMPPPLSDGLITYSDGSPQTVDQYSRDVSAFLMWAAEPHLNARKQLGFSVMVFLIVFAVLMYLSKRRVWSDVAH